MTAFESAADAGALLARHGLVAAESDVVATELGGGVSGLVVLVDAGTARYVLKRALPRLKVTAEWYAPTRRTLTEADALGFLAGITPGAVPPVVAVDREQGVLVLAAAPASWRNWQAAIESGDIAAAAAGFAGATLAAWHTATLDDPRVAARFDDDEAFESLRLAPYFGALPILHPTLAPAIERLVAPLREQRRVLVHGDFAPKNILLDGDGGGWVLDHEVARVGHPVFDLAFFTSFAVLNAIDQPTLGPALGEVAETFLTAYLEDGAPELRALAEPLAAQTALQVLARVDGASPALFLGPAGMATARSLALAALADPPASIADWWPRVLEAGASR